jgi:hypothetical protein
MELKWEKEGEDEGRWIEEERRRKKRGFSDRGRLT